MKRYKVITDVWFNHDNDVYILDKDDGGPAPFFKKENGKMTGEYKRVSIWWDWLEEIKPEQNALEELARFQTDRELNKKLFNLDAVAKNIQEEVIELAVATVECNVDEQIDALADIAVFALGDIMKLGYNPEKVLLEVAKEINSREGTFIDGKFQKDKSPEAQAKWYKADFSGCKL